MHNEAGDLYELWGARAPGPPGPPVPDGAPAPCPAKPDPSDNKRRFILSDCIKSRVMVSWILIRIYRFNN